MYAREYAPTMPSQPVLIEVTPRLAEQMLERSGSFTNRPLKRLVVEDYAASMRDGEWNTDVGDPIRVDVMGRVIDGQHRLHAVITADTPQKFYVIENLPTDAVNFIDIGTPRTGSDFVGMKGVSKPSTVMAGLKWLHRYEAGTLSSRRPIPRHKVTTYLAAHPGMVESAIVARGMRDIVGKSAVVTGTHYLFTRIDREQAQVFFEQLRTGLGLHDKHPVYHLRERMISGGAKLSEWESSALFIKAWNMVRNHRNCERLMWNRGRGEEFPVAI